LWMRSPKARAVLKIRSEVVQAIRQFYYERDFVTFDSPIFTPNPCEGTSTLFETDYFGEPMYLSQSGQLYGEAGAMAFGKIVVFGPTFRAEKSKTRRHLTEFWMIEPEVCWTNLDEVMQLAEDNIHYIVQWVLQKCRPELEAIGRDIAKLEAIQKPFPRLSYLQCQEVLQVLKRAYMKGKNADLSEFVLPEIPGMSKTIRFPEELSNKDIKRMGSDILHNGLGDDLGAADETALSWLFDSPVMIHRYPAEVKAFYMKRDPEDPKYALCVDMIGTEGFGEIVGGAMREESEEVLVAAIKKHGLEMDSFSWFLDLRKYGSVPHGGFGLGLERVLMWLCNAHHIRETVPFPRTMVRMRP
ncbi:MAG: asparagine--tRNA ligase, partial [Planctomycetes bacterium]|nr:asparagine--tRNA ligase [Planctomycetota bacterium]